jgi:hypothetical protein
MSATLDYRKHKGRRRGTSAARRSSAPALDSGSRFGAGSESVALNRGRRVARLARLWTKPFG